MILSTGREQSKSSKSLKILVTWISVMLLMGIAESGVDRIGLPVFNLTS